MKRASPATGGFVLPVTLGVVLIAALIAAQAAIGLGGAALLASQRLLHQRSFHAAEGGITAALDELRSAVHPENTRLMEVTDEDGQTVRVESAIMASTAMPEGFSAGRVLQIEYEIRSTGRGARGTAVTVVQGARQLRVASEP